MKKSTWLQIGTHVLGVAPIGWLVYNLFFDPLNFNPIQKLTFDSGWLTLVFLLASLAITPLVMVGYRQMQPLRKPLGLYAFMYGTVHFGTFIFDNGLTIQGDFAWLNVWEATFEKPYAFVGFGAYLILTVLAATSNQWSMVQLKKNWKRLHRLVYLSAILGIVHFIMLVKADIREPLAYGAVLLLLLSTRIPWVRKQITNWRNERKKRNRQQEATA